MGGGSKSTSSLSPSPPSPFTFSPPCLLRPPFHLYLHLLLLLLHHLLLHSFICVLKGLVFFANEIRRRDFDVLENDIGGGRRVNAKTIDPTCLDAGRIAIDEEKGDAYETGGR